MDKNQIAQMEANKKAILEDRKTKITSEQAGRNHIINLARQQGCEQDALEIMKRYDSLLRNCSNPIERKHIAIMGLAELHRLLNCQGALIVNEVEVLPARGRVREIIE